MRRGPLAGGLEVHEPKSWRGQVNDSARRQFVMRGEACFPLVRPMAQALLFRHMADRDAWEQPLYQFALLLLRDEEAARKAVAGILEAGIRKRPQHIDPERLIMLQFRDLRRQVLKAQSAPGSIRARKEELASNADSAARDIDAPRLAGVLHALPEPGRSAYALLLLDAMESDWIAKLLELSPAQLAETVHAARLAVHEAIAPKAEAAPQ